MNSIDRSTQEQEKKRINARLRRHLQALARRDTNVKLALQTFGYPRARIRAKGYETFLHTIVSQQISVHAAQAIWGRLEEHFAPITAQKLSRCRVTTLRRLGLSERKAGYAKVAAKAFISGDINPESLEQLDDEQVIAQITTLKGFGRWSAEIYLMFSLQRTDIFPADDLALRIALQQFSDLKECPTAKQARTIAEDWRPYRSAASLLLWHCYGKISEK